MSTCTAVQRLLARHEVDPSLSVIVRGSGGMAKAVVAALRDAGFTRGTVAARNGTTGPALAKQYGWEWIADAVGARAELIVNVTPVGMRGGADADALSFDRETIAAASVVFDVVASPSDTPLVVAARDAGVTVITGAEVVALQAEEQFVLYTGVRPTEEQVQRASESSREVDSA